MQKNFAHKKSLGQHFLNNQVIPSKMCDVAELLPGELVLEIGPGTGALTRELLSRKVRVLALEADPRAIEVLKKDFADFIARGQLTILNKDVRQLNLETTDLSDHGYKVVANIPYYLSGMLFRTFLTTRIQPKCLVFLVQKEVGKRVCAKLQNDEKESLLSLSVKAYGEPIFIHKVPRGNFTPTPKVDSAIVMVRNISRDNFRDMDEKLFFKLLRLGFGMKRKQLIGNLSKEFPRAKLIATFSTLKINESIRAEDIPLETWLKLTKALELKS
jgi:16S rRNA (adenine1518-N6/adenine1519-N6)-dimethyltransferase